VKYHIAILAGGLGSRLNNTEKRPKPLVEINGLSLLSRIIIALKETGLFEYFHILTCCDNGLYKNVLKEEIQLNNFSVYNEIKRTGRIGAIQNFLKSQNILNNFFVCNGDTLFMKLDKSEILKPIKNFTYQPIVYLAKPDSTRSDYKEVSIDYSKKSSNHQNSGLFFMSRDWFNKSIEKHPDFKDIDELLFSSNDRSKLCLLSSKLLDAGTPERLSYIRRLLN
tara:strand:+ start:2702 stop:3370 length:669 start_codon:yes stop_codon:yes gene_type:complete